jgi:hypothetical protein
MRYESSPYYNTSPQDQESRRIQQFYEVLDQVEAVKPLTLAIDRDAEKPAEAAAYDFLTVDYVPGTTLHVVPELATDFESGFLGFVPLVSRTGKASKHGVFFGSFFFTDGTELKAAIKPHTTSEDTYAAYKKAEMSCLYDYFTNVAARELGFESLEPVGLITNNQGTNYSITWLDQNLVTLDSTDWTCFFQPGFKNEGMREELAKAARITALLHATGASYHGDLAARNIATNSEGQIFLIDWEHGNITNRPARDIEERFGYSWKDLKNFADSLANPPGHSLPGIGIFSALDGNWGEARLSPTCFWPNILISAAI